MYASMAAMSLAVLSRSAWENQDRLEIQDLCLPLDQGWKQEPQVQTIFQILCFKHQEVLNIHVSVCLGVASEFMVNTCNAGSGALSVTIDGPSKVKMDCQECPEGYKVAYTPMAPGSYLISIKFGGPQHIVGSPFKAKVSERVKCSHFPAGPRLSGGHNLHEMSSVLVETVTKTSAMGGAFASFPKFSSDASKVISRGAGLSKAFIGQKNTFTVDCSKAGEKQHE
ncbi:hypothetical protein XENOCAPTIV_022544 [Xenoophorus captivus]|uniref:Uncharacterized protein n=1 Tax=Xenoophorus captivus TaxID=1517983 RepID=A0ABV0RVV2_9TELE